MNYKVGARNKKMTKWGGDHTFKVGCWRALGTKMEVSKNGMN